MDNRKLIAKTIKLGDRGSVLSIAFKGTRQYHIAEMSQLRTDDKEVAAEIVRRWNIHNRLVMTLEDLLSGELILTRDEDRAEIAAAIAKTNP